jgi:hypothetical protein
MRPYQKRGRGHRLRKLYPLFFLLHENPLYPKQSSLLEAISTLKTDELRISYRKIGLFFIRFTVVTSGNFPYK